ncbi:DMT family transporter [Fictibacillus phosphorivorans]|uniref:DMT family transporter n=1 Tax=Fictibacillus phosphorivorans TaxID=1221500 RepID=UPI001293CADE|nr:EamA family transporter [Fictibacillus phosphorivorans]MQR96325.1 EamA/RhaT family transporter [Fictibacillus phosphorivorans]
MNNDSLKIPVFIPLIIGIIAISFSSIFVKWSDAPVSVQGMYRLLFTLIMMLPFVWKQVRLLKEITWHEICLLFLSGTFLALHFLFWMGSLKLTTVASSTILLSLQPVFVMIGAYIAFREKTSKAAIIGMVVAILGAIMIGWGDIGISAKHIQGDLLSILGTIVVAAHMLIGQKLLRTFPATLYSFSVFLIAVIVFGIYNFTLDISMTGYSEQEWGIFLLLAIVPTVFGHVLFNWLLKYVTAATISMAILGEPVGATLLAFLILGETLTLFQWSGGVIVLAGLYYFLQNTRKQKKSTPPAPVKAPVTPGPIVKKG